DERGEWAEADEVAVDADALAEIDQVRAGVDAGGVPAGAQARGGHLDHAPLALAPRHVHALHIALRVVEVVEERGHALQFERLRWNALGAGPLDVGALGEVLERNGVVLDLRGPDRGRLARRPGLLDMDRRLGR